MHNRYSLNGNNYYTRVHLTNSEVKNMRMGLREESRRKLKGFGKNYRYRKWQEIDSEIQKLVVCRVDKE